VFVGVLLSISVSCPTLLSLYYYKLGTHIQWRKINRSIPLSCQNPPRGKWSCRRCSRHVVAKFLLIVECCFRNGRLFALIVSGGGIGFCAPTRFDRPNLKMESQSPSDAFKISCEIPFGNSSPVFVDATQQIHYGTPSYFDQCERLTRPAATIETLNSWTRTPSVS